MKLKLPIGAFLFLLLGLSWSQAQMITLTRGDDYPLSQTLTLTQNGPVTIIWSGDINYSTGVTATLLIDGVSADVYPIPQGGSTDYRSRPYRTDLSAGTHTIELSVSGSSQRRSPVILSIAEAEPTAGVQAALDQLMADYQSADAALQAGLTAQMNAIQAALDVRITTLENEIATLESTNSSQTALINSLMSQLTAMQNQQAEILQRLSELEQQPETSAGSTVVQSNSQDLKSSDYLIIGGSAAGATALGIGIYSILDDNSEGNWESDFVTNEKRPGYNE